MGIGSVASIGVTPVPATIASPWGIVIAIGMIVIRIMLTTMPSAGIVVSSRVFSGVAVII